MDSRANNDISCPIKNQLKEPLSRLSVIELAQKARKEIIQNPVPNISENNKTSNNKSEFPLFSYDELLSMPPKKWLVSKILGEGDIGMIYGPSGCGKTFVVIDLIMSMCTKKRWANRFSIERPLSVIYCAGEGFSGLPSRFSAAGSHLGIETLENFRFCKQIPQFYDTRHPSYIDNFVDSCKAYQKKGSLFHPDVLIIDTFNSATIGCNENDAEEVGSVMSNTRRTVEQLGCTVIFIHHTGKNGVLERGSTAARGAMDFMLDLIPHEKTFNVSMSCSKLKDDERWGSAGFSLQRADETTSAHVVWVQEGEMLPDEELCKKTMLNQQIQDNPNIAYSAKELSKKLSIGISYTIRALKELESDGFIKGRLLCPDQVRSPSNPMLYSA